MISQNKLSCHKFFSNVHGKISAQPHTLIMQADELIMYALHCFERQIKKRKITKIVQFCLDFRCFLPKLRKFWRSPYGLRKKI